jgi:hypothetical protein
VPDDPVTGWRRYLAEVTWTAWNLYDRYPGLAGEVASLRSAAPTLAAVMNRGVRMLIDAGLSPRDALLVIDMAGELALAPFALAVEHGDAPDEDGAAAPSVLDRAAARRRQLLRGADGDSSDVVLGVIRDVVADDPRQWLQAKLDLFLDGAELRIRRPAGPSSRGFSQ